MPSHSQSCPLALITPKPQTCQAISSIKASACCSLILSHDSFPQSLNDRSFPHLLCQVTCHRPELAPLQAGTLSGVFCLQSQLCNIHLSEPGNFLRWFSGLISSLGLGRPGEEREMQPALLHILLKKTKKSERPLAGSSTPAIDWVIGSPWCECSLRLRDMNHFLMTPLRSQHLSMQPASTVGLQSGELVGLQPGCLPYVVSYN